MLEERAGGAAGLVLGLGALSKAAAATTAVGFLVTGECERDFGREDREGGRGLSAEREEVSSVALHVAFSNSQGGTI